MSLGFNCLFSVIRCITINDFLRILYILTNCNFQGKAMSNQELCEFLRGRGIDVSRFVNEKVPISY